MKNCLKFDVLEIKVLLLALMIILIGINDDINNRINRSIIQPLDTF